MIQIFKIIIGYITDPKAAGRDIYLICAKSILKEISGSACFTIGNVILPFLLTGIKGDHLEIKELSFEIFNDYINTFNYILIKDNNIISEKDFICDNILKSLNIENDSLRKILTKFLGNCMLEGITQNKPCSGIELLKSKPYSGIEPLSWKRLSQLKQ